VNCESRVAEVVARGQFGNKIKGAYAVGSRYQRTGEGQQTEKIQRMCRTADCVNWQ
jgi:hypothetical protein